MSHFGPKIEKIKVCSNFMKIGTQPNLTMSSSKMNSTFQNFDPRGLIRGIKSTILVQNSGCSKVKNIEPGTF